MTQNTVLSYAAQIVDILSMSKTPEVTMSTLLAWIGCDPFKLSDDEDRKLARAINLTCEVTVRGEQTFYSLREDMRP